MTVADRRSVPAASWPKQSGSKASHYRTSITYRPGLKRRAVRKAVSDPHEIAAGPFARNKAVPASGDS